MKVLSTVGLLLIHNTHLLLVRKRNTRTFMLPGGKMDVGEQEIPCLEREIQEELQCQLQRASLHALGAFTDVAAHEPNTLVTMKLYKGQIVGTARASREIEEIHWFDLQKPHEILLAPLVQNQILPVALHFLTSLQHPLNYNQGTS